MTRKTRDLRLPASNIRHHGLQKICHSLFPLSCHQAHKLVTETDEANVPNHSDVFRIDVLYGSDECIIPLFLGLRRVRILLNVRWERFDTASGAHIGNC
jgi:hypothetical protein